MEKWISFPLVNFFLCSIFPIPWGPLTRILIHT